MIRTTGLLALAAVTALLLCTTIAQAGCPFSAGTAARNLKVHDDDRHSMRSDSEPAGQLAFDMDAFNKVDFEAVRADLVTLLHTSQPFWPADWNGNYGPFMIRLSWVSFSCRLG